jgi:RNA polymerase sigma-70 factor (ECF subfamily)
MKSKTEAEDALQETFEKLLKNKKKFKDFSHEKAWLIVTSSNICKNKLNYWFRKKITVFDEKFIPNNLHNDDSELLDEVLMLPKKFKIVIYLYYYEGYSGKEIAAILNKNEVTIRSQLSRGRKMLKKSLGGERNAI